MIRHLRSAAFLALAFLTFAPVAIAEELLHDTSAIGLYAAIVLEQHLGLRSEDLAVRSAFADELGRVHVRFDRLYHGLTVAGGDLVVHMGGGGEYIGSDGNATPITVDLNPLVRAATVEARVIRRHPQPASVRTRLEVLAAEAWHPNLLTWHVSIAGVTRAFSHEYFIDALTGRIIEEYSSLETGDAIGSGDGFFSGLTTLHTDQTGSTYDLRDLTRGGHYATDMNNGTRGSGTIFNDSDNSWGDGTTANRQSVAVDAQFNAVKTWDYYRTTHGRTGLRNDGMGALSRVHYGSGFHDAFWSESCFCVTYGDGDSTFNPLTALDYGGHELTHGVISSTAALVYRGEPGALNEATADIFGTMIEFYTNHPDDPPDWLFGERIYKAAGKFLRSLSDPRADGRSIDHYTRYSNGLDIHYTSGIANNFFYLLSQGGTNRTSGMSVPTGVGRTAAERIWYRTLTVYLTSRSGFKDARAASLKAAADLYGSGSTQYSTVGQAWAAVGVN